MPVAVTIGNFDGVHLGHRALLDACQREIGPGSDIIVIAFDPHPQAVLSPDNAPERLTSFDQRADLLLAAGATSVRKLETEPRLLAMSPQDFARQLLAEFRPGVIVEGAGFRFGRDRAGDLDLLERLAKPSGCRVVTVDPLEMDLDDQTIVPISSTRIRWLLGHGRVRDAARLLGRPYELVGPVVRCDQRGRKIGFPTANINVSTMLPADGVYAARATLPDGTNQAAAVNIGKRPTVDGSQRCVEAHVLGFDDRHDHNALPGLPEYGWTIRVKLLAWVRDEIRFGSVEALKDQLQRDCDRIKTMVRQTAGGIA